ncbi:MAG: DUF2007 domain-containing protein [Coxiellaceae bacterium]|nr:DUF2007 domain-containing protein [Coxiellaceae bacterium]
MKKIYQTENRVTLNVLKDTLESSGIACLIKNEYPPAAGEITPIVAWPEIWIMNNDDEAKANEIIAAIPSNESVPTGYWLCSKCNEKVENNFNICWNCQTSQDSS